MIKTALTVLAVAGTGLFAQGDDPGTPVATVDGQVIERQTFDHWMRVAAKSSSVRLPDRADGYRRCVAAKRKATPRKDRSRITDATLRARCRRDYVQLRDQVMQLLISFKWIEGEAAALNVTVTEAEAVRELDEQVQQSFPTTAEFEAFLEEAGQTRADVLQRIRLDLLSNKIRDKVVAGHERVSEQEIEAFYAANQARFALPERRALRIVLTKREAEADRARAALERGDSWKAVARRYSIDGTSKRKGGRLPPQAQDTLDRALDRAVFRAVRHRLVGPVRTRYGYYVFTVTKIVPARQRPLSEVRRLIQQTLASQARQTALAVFVRDFTARWRAKTECAAGYRVADCRNGPATTPRRIVQD